MTTFQEARAFLGLPDVKPVQEEMLKEVQPQAVLISLEAVHAPAAIAAAGAICGGRDPGAAVGVPAKPAAHHRSG